MRRIFILPLLIAMALTTMGQGRSIDHPMTRAVIDAYSKILKADPTDYETYFHRASEYYNHNEYILALKDIDEALKYTPDNERDFRFQEYSLRANIYLQTNKPEQALIDLNQALTIVPTSYSTLYLKANTEYTLGHYSQAKQDYARIIGLNPRSSVAYLGLARIAVKENNLGTANDYLEQAVAINPNDAEAYLRRANVRQMMGNDNGAVDDLLVALSINATNPKAIEALINYADTNYAAVMAGLSSAISQAPQNALFWYLRAQVAQAHNHYAAAVADYQKILDDQLYNYRGIYASIAECQYYMGDNDKALDNVDYALTAITDSAPYYILKSKILRAKGDYDGAIDAAAKASAVDRNSGEALAQMALCYIDKQDYTQAAALLGEACMTDTQNPYIYLIRADLLEKHLNQPVAANQFRQQVIDMEGYGEDNVKSLKGIAMLNAGNTTGAMAWIDGILPKDHDGLAHYYAACIYSALDNNERAISCAEESLKLGYANYYNWMLNEDAPCNVAPLRDDLRFLNLISRYNNLFDKE